MNPRRKPNPASSAANATISQSSVVIRAPRPRSVRATSRLISHVLPFRGGRSQLDRRERDVRDERPGTASPAIRPPSTPTRMRARPVIALAALAFVSGRSSAASHGPDAAHALAARFVTAWTRGEYVAMYGDIDASSKREISPQELADDYEHALRTATATRLQVTGKPRDISGGLVAVPVRVRTRLFGTLQLAFALKIVGGGGAAKPAGSPGRGRWSSPACARARCSAARWRCRAGRRCWRATGRCSPKARPPKPDSATRRSAPSPARRWAKSGPSRPRARAALEAEGVPADAIVGVSGVEEALDDSLRGTPGGELLASSAQPGGPARVLAIAVPKAAPTVRTTISPAVQRAAVAALGRSAGRGRGDTAEHRTDPGGRRTRDRRSAAAGLDVQDGHRQRRPAGRDRQSAHARSPTRRTRRSTASS